MKIEDVIAAASEELQVSYSENALWFKVLVNQVLTTFRAASVQRTFNVVIEAEDSRLKLPEGYTVVKKVNICDGASYCEGFDYEIQNGYIIFKSILNIADNTRFEVEYRGFPIDDEGNVYLKPEWERMLVAYIGWKYSRRHFDRYGAVLESYKREYQYQRAANF
jgi:hypothetical protein